jgi:valyl-tRNA synthetase
MAGKTGENYLQETGTFDTWFSSSQWPVITLKANEQTVENNDFKRFYPTEVMETAYDILPFWVMRMMMMGIYLTGKIPFKKVYFHGLVRDEKGQKMSKSKGNVINPLFLVDKYGADALRMALVMSTTAGHDSAVGEMKVKGMRNFSNKIWNAARFVALRREDLRDKKKHLQINQEDDKNRLGLVVSRVTKQLNELKIGLAAETAYNEFWHWWCDEVLEKHKLLDSNQDFLEEGMKVWLRLLHPFMPFVTEAVWQELGNKELLIKAEWPQLN